MPNVPIIASTVCGLDGSFSALCLSATEGTASRLMNKTGVVFSMSLLANSGKQKLMKHVGFQPNT